MLQIESRKPRSDVDLIVNPDLWCVRTRRCRGAAVTASANRLSPQRTDAARAYPSSTAATLSCSDRYQLPHRGPLALTPELILGMHGPGEAVQWAFAARRGHPLLRHIMDRIREKADAVTGGAPRGPRPTVPDGPGAPGRVASSPIRTKVPKALTLAVSGPQPFTEIAITWLLHLEAISRGVPHSRLSGQPAHPVHGPGTDPSAMRVANFFQRFPRAYEVSTLGPQDALIVGDYTPAARGFVQGNDSSSRYRIGTMSGSREMGATSSALILGEMVLQNRFLCHHFLGSWKWDDRHWTWRLRHQWREQWRRPCEYWHTPFGFTQ